MLCSLFILTLAIYFVTKDKATHKAIIKHKHKKKNGTTKQTCMSGLFVHVMLVLIEYFFLLIICLAPVSIFWHVISDFDLNLGQIIVKREHLQEPL